MPTHSPTTTARRLNVLAAAVVAAVLGLPPAGGLAAEKAQPANDGVAKKTASRQGDAKKGSGKKAASLPDGVNVERDLAYVTRDSGPLLLDLYRPDKAAGKVPVVVWVHGGGWLNGSKENCPAAWLSGEGYAVASINYRLADAAQWPSQLDDCRDAVRWLRQNAEKYGLDNAHIAAWGSSAGGHLVALMGTADLPEGDPGRVQAVIDWYGPTDLLTMPPNMPGPKKTDEALANSNGAKLLGRTVKDVPELAKAASAYYQASAGDAPFLIMHGDADPGVPIDQSKKLAEKLKEAGVPVEMHVVAGGGHGGKEFQTDAVREQIRQFLARTLKQ